VLFLYKKNLVKALAIKLTILKIMNESSNLCLSCGLCCDGTLIGFVELANEELVAARKTLDIEEENGHGFLLQPCSKYCNGCTVYDKRPKHCASFKCGRLQSLEQKEVNFEQASAMIQEVKLQKTRIDKKLASLDFDLKSPSFYFKMIELMKLLKEKEATSVLQADEQELMKELKQFNRLTSKNMGMSFY
jgi:Fe-S-cluster containining protein